MGLPGRGDRVAVHVLDHVAGGVEGQKERAARGYAYRKGANFS